MGVNPVEVRVLSAALFFARFSLIGRKPTLPLKIDQWQISGTIGFVLSSYRWDGPSVSQYSPPNQWEHCINERSVALRTGFYRFHGVCPVSWTAASNETSHSKRDQLRSSGMLKPRTLVRGNLPNVRFRVAKRRQVHHPMISCSNTNRGSNSILWRRRSSRYSSSNDWR